MYVNENASFLPEVSIRWLTVACYEIRVGDFTIVTDPCIRAAKHAAFTPDVIENPDLILLSHAHWDHTWDIKELMERSNCKLAFGELSMEAVGRMIDVNPIRLYPMTPDLELDFGGARVKALFGRHVNQRHTFCEHEINAINSERNDTPEKARAALWGMLEYRNYLITTPSGLKIIFWGNNATPEQIAIFRREQPDIGIMQFTGSQTPEEIAALAQAANLKVFLPHHMDLGKAPEEYLPRIDALEVYMREACPSCTVIHPRQLQWMDFGLGFRAQ